ncbi:MAG: carboxypeptidase-like regulatory domain-containing protein, partial [Bacteroidota bacterium]|nr:carboxypeptidase-like regulatory domain-containing protein [Bacteroidota bacterium]
MNQPKIRTQISIAQDYQLGWEKSLAEYDRQRSQTLQLAKRTRNPIAIFKITALLIFLTSQVSLFGQNLTQTIRGKIIDRESQAPLMGASVAIVSLNPVKGSTTDNEGFFKIEKVPLGRHTLKINYIGYQEQVIPELLLGSGKEIILTIGLTESIRQMDEVVITAKPEKGQPLNDMATLSARSISVEETKRYAASVNDPARAALS